MAIQETSTLSDLKHSAHLWFVARSMLIDAGCPIHVNCHIPSVLSQWLERITGRPISMDMIPMREAQETWRDIKPGEAGRFSNGTLVVRLDPACELSDGLRSEEAQLMGVVVWTDDGNGAPGALIVIGSDTTCERVVWHGSRVRSR